MKHLRLFKTLLIAIGLLAMSINQMWASEPHFSYVTGGSTTDISHALVAPANDSYDEYCIYLWVEKNTYFQFNTQKNNGGTPGIYRPDASNDRNINSSTGAGTGTYDGSKSWKYTGNTGLTKINAAQSSSREWGPYVWIDSENLETAILQGTKIMFYFGSSYSSTWLYLKTHEGNPNAANQQYYVLDDVTKSGTTTYYTVAYAAAGDYYISNSSNWGGHQFNSTKAASAGALLSLGNTDYKYDGVIPAFSSSTYNHATGVAVSSISATASNSVVGNSQEIMYYYTTSSTPGSASFTAFDPSDISDLSAGTYYLYALGWDGHILVRSNVATLTVADAPGISLSIEDGSSNVITAARSGDEITLVATPVNAGASPNIVFEWSSSSTFASDIHEIASSTSTSTTWDVPVDDDETTYYLRARISTVGKVCSSAISSFTGYGKKTIHVRNNNNWGSFKIHHWGTNDAHATSWGSLPSCTSEGGQWYTVVIYSCYDGFCLTNGGSNDQDKTIDLDYDSGSPTPADGGYYTMSTNASNKQTLSSSSAPTAPTSVTTSDEDPTSVTNAQMTIHGDIGGNGNDNITDYGFYWGTTDACGTQAQVGTSNTTGAISKQLTTLTAGTTYYFKTYATNGQGTSYGDVESYKLPYKVTVNTSTGCSSITNSGTNYTNSTIEVTATKTTGYTFSSWSTTNGTQTSTSSEGNTNTLVFTPSADNATISPVYTENSYSTNVVISPAGKGSISSPTPSEGKISVKQVTGTAVTASANTNYVFTGWGVADGGLTVSSTTTNPATFKATAANGTITANFADEWNVKGSWDSWAAYKGMPYAGVTNQFSTTVTLAANTSYTFKVVKRAAAGGEDVWYTKAGTTFTRGGTTSVTGLSIGGSDNEMTLTTDAAGDYTITYTYNASEGSMQVAVGFPTAYAMTFAPKSFYNGGASSETSTNGGTLTVKDQTNATLSTGNYVKNGGTATFTAAKNTGYTFDGFFSDEGCTTEYEDNDDDISISGENDEILTLSSIGEAKNVYAKFSEVMTTVTLSATNGKIQYWDGDSWEDAPSSESVGVHTTCSLKVVPNTGYYFSGWTRSDGADFHLNGYAEANTNVTLTGDGAGTSGTLTANFEALDKIYFRNVFDDGENPATHWDNVYVFFDITWNGYGQAQTKNDDTYRAVMTQIGETDIYWAYVPRAFTVKAGDRKNVGFADTYFDKNYTFYNVTGSGSKAATRGDYNRALDLFVPHHAIKTTNNYGVDYYDNGFWMKHETRAMQGAGYYLKKYDSRGNYTDKGEFAAVADNSTTIQVTVRVDNLTDEYNKFMLTASGGLNYLADEEITSLSGAVGVSDDTREIASNDVFFQLKPTAEGNYTFILDQSGDKMTLRVDYPVSPGDYRLKHTYTRSETTYTTYSDVIKSSAASSGVTASMYLSTEGTETLVLQECERIDGTTKQPVWSAGDETNLSAITTAVGTNYGVYQFDITVNTTTDKANTVTNIKKYEGDFYIKTDCAPGNWVNYKNNVMDKNTINASDFDNYFCKNVSSGTNVKFVVANDYNIAVSDTIIQDATYLTTSGEGSSKEFMPESSCIRFSYNSATNEAKRAYLRYSNNNNFLNIIPSGTSKVYDAASDGNDLYNSGNAGTVNKFSEDDHNFVYRKTVYAVSGASIDVKAEYTTSSNKQTFVTGQTLISSSDEEKLYPVRIVYDFKTNHLSTAWEATVGLTEALKDIEFIYVRNGQNAANQVTFGTGGSITDSKVCGVFQFDYDDYVGRVGAWPQQDGQATGYTNQKCMFYFSFPFEVNVSDIFGIGTYGKEWKIQYYDGAERASKGFFRGDGTTTFWKDMPVTGTLEAYVGYSLLLDNDYFNTTSSDMVFEGKTSGKSVYLYFPSAKTMSSVTSTSKTVKVPAHLCEIERTFDDGSGRNTVSHTKTDSHWNMLGVPLLSNHEGDFSEIFTQSYDDMKYLYAWNAADNSLSPVAAGSSAGQLGNFTFNAMGAYMVQYAGDITFTGSVPVPASVAARRTEETKNYKVYLEVLDGEDSPINHTYIELSEGASDDFELNEDLYLTTNSKNVNVYSFAGDYNVAANVLSHNNHTVPVGVIVNKNGTYKFSMPYEFSGTVTLVDTYTGARTDLAFGDYEVYMDKGTVNDRFVLEINIHKIATAIDGAESGCSLKDGKAHKFIMNDQMYILKNGVMYDARGAKVK